MSGRRVILDYYKADERQSEEERRILKSLNLAKPGTGRSKML